MSKTNPSESGQATVEFALTLPFLFLFAFCVVQLGSVTNDQLVLNHLAQASARAISLADVASDSAQQIAVATIERETTLQGVDVVAALDADMATVELAYRRSVSLPIIGALFDELELHASATVPRQITAPN